jgi:hypothetical protein
MAEVDPQVTLATLSSSLTTLEESLAPLLATPFEDLTQDLDPLQKAKLEVMTGYVVHDLIWSECSAARWRRRGKREG